MANTKVIGLDRVLFNINREVNSMVGRTVKGMMLAMEHLETQMDTISPTVPEDTRAMRESWYIFPVARPGNPIVMAGYTSPYAPAVHEMIGPVNWTKAGSGAKWLQIHFARNRMEMQLIIAQHAQIL